jgi:hypothetical protein
LRSSTCNKEVEIVYSTGKSLSEALLFAEHGENMLCTKKVLNFRNNFCTQHVLPRFELGIFMYLTCNKMNKLLSYCGLVDAKIGAFDKDLPVSLLFTAWKYKVTQENTDKSYSMYLEW